MRSAWREVAARAACGMLVAGTMACDRAPVKSPAGPSGPAGPVAAAPESARAPGAAPDFAARAARLASVPAGHEMGEARFSADGRHVAFVATRDGTAFVFLDAKRYGPYEEARGLFFPGGRSGLAFVARRGGREFVVVDGVEGAGYGAVATVLSAPDGRMVYSARRDDRWLVVAGAREAAVPGAADPWPCVSTDGRRVVYTERHPGTGKSHLRACSLELEDCVTGGEYDDMASQGTDASRTRLAFIAGRNGKQSVATVDLDRPGLVERTAEWYDAVLLFAVSDGGGHLAFLARRGSRQLLVRDGRELPVPEAASPLDLIVSRNGRALLTAILESKVLAFVDGKRVGREHQGIEFPVFSPDGSRHAYVAGGDSGSVVVVDGEEGPPFDRVVTPRFAPDGARLVYRARRSGERFAVVADARARTVREHPHHQAVFDVVFSPDGKSVGYGVRAGQELWWKVEKL